MNHSRHSERIALRIVEALEAKWPNLCLEGWDSDEARERIALEIPACVQEAEEEYERISAELNEERASTPGPSPFARLREAVHATPEMSLKTVLEAAIAKCEELRKSASLIELVERQQVLLKAALRYLPHLGGTKGGELRSHIGDLLEKIEAEAKSWEL